VLTKIFNSFSWHSLTLSPIQAQQDKIERECPVYVTHRQTSASIVCTDDSTPESNSQTYKMSVLISLNTERCRQHATKICTKGLWLLLISKVPVASRWLFAFCHERVFLIPSKGLICVATSLLSGSLMSFIDLSLVT